MYCFRFPCVWLRRGWEIGELNDDMGWRERRICGIGAHHNAGASKGGSKLCEYDLTYDIPLTGADILSLQLWSLIPAEKRDEYLSGSKKDTVPVLDLLPLGYSKVLGKGRIPEVPLVVRARWFSKEAERKITEAGGVVELVA